MRLKVIHIILFYIILYSLLLIVRYYFGIGAVFININYLHMILLIAVSFCYKNEPLEYYSYLTFNLKIMISYLVILKSVIESYKLLRGFKKEIFHPPVLAQTIN